ncbi:CalY family protein [Fictibacillus phosphorivorans]|uniref:CalY family protein n=1 Tax=Fictibacillus phosphorivorans TaxID=1221500 RepID=UPI00203DB562|nr:CalY family protein [Fictibacillus phosphorivorans]MCM3717675.1 CalY family protein [Fictibacillus phosphorivorans]MCM3775575.1 CalY family protein [Fictibacillus phosphorivorans]
MKVAKKALLGTALAGALVVSAGFGTYSWFTDVKSANATIDGGTLSLGMDTKLFTHENFAPSQMLVSEFKKIDNTGSLNQILRATYTHSVDKAPVNKYKVGYMAIKYAERPNETILKDMVMDYQNNFDKGVTNPVVPKAAKSATSFEVEGGMLSDEQTSALKAQASNNEKTINFGEGKFWKLRNNQNIEIMFFVKLLDSAGNEYQGAHYDAQFKVEAKQTDDGAKFGPEAGTN